MLSGALCQDRDDGASGLMQSPHFTQPGPRGFPIWYYRVE